MSLQTRFVLLFLVITVIVSLCLAAALHFGRRLEHELTRPYRGTLSSLSLLADLRRATRVTPSDRATALAAATRRLDLETAPEQIGPGAQRALRLHASLLASDPEASAEPLLALVERTEAAVHEAAGHDQRYGRQLSDSYRVVLVLGLLLALLTSTLAALLVRRWLVAPVLTLHVAAERFASGDLSHRVAVTGRGELVALGHKLNEMAETIERMQREAVERERLAAMGEMVRRLAHNIRSPIAGIRGMAELTLRRHQRGEPIETQQQEIMDAVDRFDLWLTELVDVTTPCRVRPAAADPRAWLSRVLQSLQPLAETKGQRLVVDSEASPETVFIDERHLEHALVAILTNAIEVAPRGSDIDVTLATDGAKAWRLSVSDRGPGIAPDVVDRVFQPYFTTKRNGNGIGLAVAMEVARRHGGDIRIRTTPGQGTTMSILLPLTPPEGLPC